MRSRAKELKKLYLRTAAPGLTKSLHVLRSSRSRASAGSDEDEAYTSLDDGSVPLGQSGTRSTLAYLELHETE